MHLCLRNGEPQGVDPIAARREGGAHRLPRLPRTDRRGRSRHFAMLPVSVARGFLGLAAIALAFGPASAEEPNRGGTLIYAVNGEPETYDCHASTTQATLHVLAPHYSTLLKIDPTNYPNVTYGLARAYTISADNLVYTFKLRDGVRFHDGTPLTAIDVKASYERLRNPPEGVVSARSAAFRDIESIETPDPLTVVFRLRRPNSSMLNTFALSWNCIYSAKRLADDPKWPQRNVMGSGPFVFVRHMGGSHWEGRRFDDYFEEGKPYLDGFRAQFMTSTAVINSLQGGAIHAEFRGVSPGQRNHLKDALRDEIAVQTSPWICATQLFFNVGKKPFDDPRVRRALSLAIDRWDGAEQLSRIAFVRYVGGVLRPGYALAASDEELAKLPGFGRDIKAAREEAQKLLRAAGAENLTFKLLNRTTQMPYMPVALYLVDQWRQIGVTAEHTPMEVAVQKASFAANTFEVGLDGVCEDLDDPNVQLLQFISTDRSARSRGGFVDRELDALFEQQKNAANENERRALIRRFEARVLEQANTIPVVWWNRMVAHSAKMKGWHITPSLYVGQDLAGVWLAE